MPADKDVIYTAATHIQTNLEKMGKKIAPSHAHEFTAAYLGYNSKIALVKSEDFDLTDPEMVLSVTPDLEKLDEQVRKRRPDLFQKIPLPALGRLIQTGLTPPCECCGNRVGGVVPITNPEYDEVDGWVCRHCVDRHEAYDTCWCCGDSIVYRAQTLNHARECPDHAGESRMDPEEEAGWIDLIQNLQNQ